MNTEINFLEKKPKKHLPAILIGILFLFLFALVLALIFLQRGIYMEQLENEEKELARLEDILDEQQETTEEAERLVEVYNATIAMQEERLPIVRMYDDITNLLPDINQLVEYNMGEQSEVMLEVEFSTIEQVAGYIAELAGKTYINDTQLTSVDANGDGYLALLTIGIDQELAIEELNYD